MPVTKPCFKKVYLSPTKPTEGCENHRDRLTYHRYGGDSAIQTRSVQQRYFFTAEIALSFMPLQMSMMSCDCSVEKNHYKPGKSGETDIMEYVVGSCTRRLSVGSVMNEGMF